MRLAEWRKGENLTQAELAEALGCDQSFISLIERAIDAQIPGRDWMIRIYRQTRGAVTPNDFYNLPELEQLSLPIVDSPAPPPAPLLDAVQPTADEPQPERIAA